MIYILWGLLNLFLFAGFVVVAYYAVKQIRIKYGLFISLFFVAATCSFMGQSADDKRKDATMQTLHFYEGNRSLQFPAERSNWFLPDSLTRHYTLADKQSHVIYETPFAEIKLRVTYAKDRLTEKKIPVYAYSSFAGAMIGTAWRPAFTIINADADGKTISYQLTGTMEWKLMNITVYTETKNLQGTLKIE